MFKCALSHNRTLAKCDIMFTDSRSKKIVLVAHCILNQNSISDGTADYPGSISEIVEFLFRSNVGIIQMPCPEMLCLGLNRGNIHGAEQSVVVENTRIRNSLSESSSIKMIRSLVHQLAFQVEEYIEMDLLYWELLVLIALPVAA